MCNTLLSAIFIVSITHRKHASKELPATTKSTVYSIAFLADMHVYLLNILLFSQSCTLCDCFSNFLQILCLKTGYNLVLWVDVIIGILRAQCSREISFNVVSNCVIRPQRRYK